MESIKLGVGTFMGNTQKMRTINGFTLSKTKHIANTIVPKHEHEHPYISLLLNGIYHEKSIISKQDIVPGISLFRPKEFEHTNKIGIKESLCFNIEIEKNILDTKLCFRKNDYMMLEKNSLEVMKICYSFLNNFSDELLSITVEENLYQLFKDQKREAITGRALWINQLKKQVRFQPEIKYSLDDVSKSFHLHPVYLSRKFKEVTGYTFGEFLLRQRLAKGVDLMLTTKKSLTSIALESGFYDQSHFIKHFKNIFNVSPSFYRTTVKG